MQQKEHLNFREISSQGITKLGTEKSAQTIPLGRFSLYRKHLSNGCPRKSMYPENLQGKEEKGQAFNAALYRDVCASKVYQ